MASRTILRLSRTASGADSVDLLGQLLRRGEGLALVAEHVDQPEVVRLRDAEKSSDR